MIDDLQTVVLKRDCQAIQIPLGETVVLKAETEVTVTQTLGGTITVRAPLGLFRIDAKDHDALGIELAPEPSEVTSEDVETLEPGDVEARVWESLRTCYDPEIPVNIVDLGLIYDLSVEELEEGQRKVQVKMTLTAQGCGMGPAIAGDAQNKILSIPSVKDAEVHVVWDPPWHQSMISAEGRKILGL